MCSDGQFDLIAHPLLSLSTDPDDGVRWSAAYELGAWLPESDDVRLHARVNELANDDSAEIRQVIRQAAEEA
jgi:hypothetical protein